MMNQGESPAPSDNMSADPAIEHRNDTPILTISDHHILSENKANTNCEYEKFSILVDNLRNHPEITLVNFKNPHVILDQRESIPSERILFPQYCYKAHITAKNTLDYVFKIKCENPIFSKLKRSLMNWLKGELIYVYLTRLETSKKSLIGWLKYSHVKFTNKEELVKELSVRMGTETPFQLVPRKITKGTMTTFALAIECPTEYTTELKTNYFAHHTPRTNRNNVVSLPDAPIRSLVYCRVLLRYTYKKINSREQ